MPRVIRRLLGRLGMDQAPASEPMATPASGAVATAPPAAEPGPPQAPDAPGEQQPGNDDSHATEPGADSGGGSEGDATVGNLASGEPTAPLGGERTADSSDLSDQGEGGQAGGSRPESGAGDSGSPPSAARQPTASASASVNPAIGSGSVRSIEAAGASGAGGAELSDEEDVGADASPTSQPERTPAAAGSLVASEPELGEATTTASPGGASPGAEDTRRDDGGETASGMAEGPRSTSPRQAPEAAVEAAVHADSRARPRGQSSGSASDAAASSARPGDSRGGSGDDGGPGGRPQSDSAAEAGDTRGDTASREGAASAVEELEARLRASELAREEAELRATTAEAAASEVRSLRDAAAGGALTAELEEMVLASSQRAVTAAERAKKVSRALGGLIPCASPWATPHGSAMLLRKRALCRGLAARRALQGASAGGESVAGGLTPFRAALAAHSGARCAALSLPAAGVLPCGCAPARTARRRWACEPAPNINAAPLADVACFQGASIRPRCPPEASGSARSTPPSHPARPPFATAALAAVCKQAPRRAGGEAARGGAAGVTARRPGQGRRRADGRRGHVPARTAGRLGPALREGEVRGRGCGCPGRLAPAVAGLPPRLPRRVEG